MGLRHDPAHNRARVAHNRAYLFWQTSVFTNRAFNLRIFAAVICFAQRVSHHHWKQCFDNDCSCDTFKCTKSACFGAESTRSRTAILSAICPVVCCAMLSCVQVDSVVCRVTRDVVCCICCILGDILRCWCYNQHIWSVSYLGKHSVPDISLGMRE